MDRFFISYTYEGGTISSIGKSQMMYNMHSRKGPIIRAQVFFPFIKCLIIIIITHTRTKMLTK